MPVPAPRSISPASCSSRWRRSDIQPIAYRGSTAVLPDLLAGRITMSFSNVVNVAPLVREGKLRAFAVSSRKRSALVPDLPTMAEIGLSRASRRCRGSACWRRPARRRRSSTRCISETVRVLALPDVRKRLEDLGLDVIGGTPAEFAAVIRTEIP